MNRLVTYGVAFAFAFLLVAGHNAPVRAAAVVYSPPKSEEVKSRVLACLSELNATVEQRERVITTWMGIDENVTPDRLLELVVQSFAHVDTDVMKLLQECNAPSARLSAPNVNVLKPSVHNRFFLANLNLFYGRCLTERRLFDEAWEVLKSIDVQEVVDPSSLFFFRAVAAQGMLELKPALEAIDDLLTNTERVPVRYSATAALMQADLQGLQEKSLGELAKLMSDSERRLDLGRAGEKVQGVQERIIANLDEIIKKVEQQQGGGGGGGGGQGGQNNNPGGAADDSQVKGQEAPGEVDKKRFDNKGSWGNLPEKDLTKAKNDLNKNFPSNYEQAIEKYTKKLASRTAKKNK